MTKTDVEIFEVLHVYADLRGIQDPMLAAETLSLERFFVEKPKVVQGIEYFGLFQPTDTTFSSLFIGNVNTNHPMGAMYHLTRIVGEAYGLEVREPIVRNRSILFHALGLALLSRETGLISPDECSNLPDFNFSELYPHGLQPLLAEIEKTLSKEQLEQMGNVTLSEEYLGALMQGLDFINYYHPLFNEYTGNKVESEIQTLLGLAVSLKQNGIMLVQYDPDLSYSCFHEVKAGLQDKGLEPILETGRHQKPFLAVPSQVCIYRRSISETVCSE